MNRNLRLLSTAVAFAIAFWSVAASATPKVAVSIMPIHSLVAGVMKGVGEPVLIMDPTISEHHYSLKPSDARKISNADIIFVVSDDLERALVDPIANLAPSATRIALIDAPGLRILPRRTNNLWHNAEEEEAHDHEHEGNKDLHIWLSPNNAIAMVKYIAQVLASKDEDNASRYEENANEMVNRIYAMDQMLAKQLAFYKKAPYLVLHDAYQYFETHYGLNALGAISIAPDVSPGAKRMKQLKDLIVSQGVNCVFSEPQNRTASTVFLAEQAGVNIGELDPIGAKLTTGDDAYVRMMQNIGNGLAKCFTDLRGE
jgi:zinc transport system substrate-binding protein